ncbi:MAG: tetratricopeptide repeat protein [Vicinamibacterales bacterium]
MANAHLSARAETPRGRHIARSLRLVVFASVLGLLTSSPGVAQQVPTFSRDIAPILFAHCATCHRPGEVGGFSLLSFADVRPRAAAIARATRLRAMPPWKPDAIPGASLLGARGLDEHAIDLIERWAAGGALEGAPADLPAAPTFPDGWQLGQPDLVVSMNEPYVVAAGGRDILRNFVIPLNLPAGRYVRGLEFRPGNARVVHHANIRVDRARAARTADGADAEPGFDGRLNAGAEYPGGQFLGWTPGQLPPMLGGDSAWWLDAGSDLVVQLHLRPTDRQERVQVRIGLFFTDEVPKHTPVMVRLGKQDIDLRAGVNDYHVEDSYRLPVAAELLAIQPHAHFRAREVSASAQLPDGSIRQLLHIASWDFDWQDQYRYADPVRLPAGSVLRMTYRFDNSASNPRNPDFPPRRVRWGQNSNDEMGDVWFQLVAPDERTRARLLADAGQKVLGEDAVGFETLLEAEPGNPRLHEAAAAIFLTLGQTSRGVDHLERALGLDPRSVEAHYNLATALAWQGRTGDAIAHLRETLAADPTHVGARVNLGALLRSNGEAQAATTELRRALQLAPSNAAAHANLAGILMQEGRVTEAVTEYRAALSANPALPEALTELAWTLATSPSSALRNPLDATRYAERARDLTNGTDVRALDALAAAYAASERYTEAASTVDAALQLIPDQAPGGDEARRLLQQRLVRYRGRQPYRDPTRVDK